MLSIRYDRLPVLVDAYRRTSPDDDRERHIIEEQWVEALDAVVADCEAMMKSTVKSNGYAVS